MAYTYRNATQANAQTGDPITHNHTPGAAATLAILSIVVQGTTARTGGSPTIDGTTATQIDSTRSSTENLVEVWYVCKSFSGAQFSVSIPNSGSLTCHIEVVTADAGTGYASELNNANGNTATSATDDGLSVNVTSAAIGDFLYARLVCGEASVGSVDETSTGPTKTDIIENDHGAYTSSSHYANADSVGTETFTWVWTNDVGAAVAGCWKSVEGITDISRSQGEKATVKDSKTVQLDKLIPTKTDKVSVKDVATVLLSALCIYAVERVAVADTRTVNLPIDDISISMQEKVTVSDSKNQEILTFNTGSDSLYGTMRFQYQSSAEPFTGAGLPLSINRSEYVAAKDSKTVAVVEPDITISKSEKVDIRDQSTKYIDPLIISKREYVTAKDSKDSKLDPLIISRTEQVTVRDTKTVLISPLLVSKSETVTVKDSKDTRLNPLIISKSEYVTAKDSNTVEVETPPAEEDIEISKTEQVTVRDLSDKLISPLLVSKQEVVTVKDIKDAKLDKLLISKPEYVTASDSKTVRISPLLISKSEYVAVKDSKDIRLDKLIVSRTEQVTVKDQKQLYLPTLIVSKQEIVSVKDQSSKILDKLLISKQEIVSAKDSRTITVGDADISISKSEQVAVSDRKAAELSFIELAKSEKVTVKDQSQVQLDKLLVYKQEKVNVADSKTVSVSAISEGVQSTSGSLYSIRRYQYQSVAEPFSGLDITLNIWKTEYVGAADNKYVTKDWLEIYKTERVSVSDRSYFSDLDLDVYRQEKVGVKDQPSVGYPTPLYEQTGSPSLYSIRRFQYQSSAEPLKISVGVTETVTVDKWLGQYPDRVARRTYSQSGLAEVPSNFWLETITLDKWTPTQQDILPVKSYQSGAIQAGSLFFIDIPRIQEVYLPGWSPIYPDIISRVARSNISDIAQVLYPFAIAEPKWLIDKWIPRYPDFFKKRYLLDAIQAGSFFFDDLPRTEFPTVNKWLPIYDDILLRKLGLAEAIQSGSFSYDWGAVFAEYPARIDIYGAVYPDILLSKQGVISAIEAGACFLVGEPITSKTFVIYVWKRTA